MSTDQPNFGFVPPPKGEKQYQLNADELAKIRHYAKHGKFTGGYQSMCKDVFNRVDWATGKITLDDAFIGKIDRYATRYGRGGFQDSFLRPVFRRILNL